MKRPIYIAYGANLGAPLESFRQASAQLTRGGARIVQTSGLWQSPSWPPGTEAPDYINACAQIDFSGNAQGLLHLLHQVEAALGRERNELNAPRTLDLDLLDFRGDHIDAADIVVPHPRMMTRGFVLFPLSQIAPDWQHPVLGENINDAISQLPLSDVAPMKYLGRQDFSAAANKRGKNA